MRNLLFFVLLCLTACGERKESVPDDKESLSFTLRDKPIEQDEVIFKDESLFSKEFVGALKASKYPGTIYVMEDYIIVDNDTVALTNLLKMSPEKGVKKKFKGADNGVEYELTITHTTLVDIVYSFIIKPDRERPEILKGKAYMQPLFFLGSETTEDENGNGILCDEYISEDWNLKICEKDNGELRAVFGNYDVLLFEQ